MSNEQLPDEKYKENYSENDFWDKVTNTAKKAGTKVIETALKMYYSAQDSNTPMWAKTVIYGALGYFILPIDAIPDVTPVVGFSDDLATLTAALGTVAMHVKDEHVAQAKEKIQQWFG